MTNILIQMKYAHDSKDGQTKNRALRDALAEIERLSPSNIGVKVGVETHRGFSKERVLQRLSVFARMEPERKESWRSWYSAAFDMLAQEIEEMRVPIPEKSSNVREHVEVGETVGAPPIVQEFHINPIGEPNIECEGNVWFVHSHEHKAYRVWAERTIAALRSPSEVG